MGVKSLPRICAKLIEHGKDPATPAATIQWGTRPEQRTCVATLRDLPQKVTEQKISSPAITIVGKVVTMRQTINWFETRPLFGQTIVVTRTRQQASELTSKLEELGANVIEAPTIELVPPENWDEVDEVLASPPLPLGEGGGEGLNLQPLTPTLPPPASTREPRERGQDQQDCAQWDWIIFTSANGVRFVRDRLRERKRDVRVFGNAKIAAIGDATASAVEDELALHGDLCPESFVAEALADALAQANEITGKRFLLLRADIARPILRERLVEGRAAEVRDLAIYQTKQASSLPAHLVDAIDARRVHWVTFTSSSTARNFVSLLGADYQAKLQGVKLASIGPVTTATLKELGLTPTVEASTYNIDGLIDAIRGSAAP
jgi:uroporphyrinogen III methyltransferase/synthase